MLKHPATRPDFEYDPATIDSPSGPLVMAMAGIRPTERSSPTHSHARGALVGLSSGLLSLDVVQNAWVVPAIHAVWLPPHHPHSGTVHGDFVGWTVYVSEEACADLPSRPCTIRISSLLREAVLRAATWEGGSFDAQRRNVAGVILDEIRTLPVETFGLPLPRDPRLERIARALITDPADDRDLERWAQWAAIGNRTLSRRFVAETGFTFTTWRQRARLLRSLDMLSADMPIGAIALDLGYSTASSFISVFRQCFGETPAAYRRRL